MMNFFAILLDNEAAITAYECAGVGGSSVGALVGVDADLDVPTTQK